MSDERVMNMPIRRFWLFVRSLDRVLAAEDMRALSVAAASGATGDYLSNVRQQLIVEMGTITVVDHVADKGASNVLKALAAKNIGDTM